LSTVGLPSATAPREAHGRPRGPRRADGGWGVRR